MKRASACHSVGRQAGGSGSLITIEPILFGGHLVARLIDHAHVIARHRHRRRTVFDRQHAETHRISGDRPAGLGLPPMIDHRFFQEAFRPFEGRRIGALAGEKQRAEFREIMLGEQLALRVFFFDGAEGGRRGEQRRAAVLGNHPPECAGVRRPDRLAFIEDRGAAVQERPIDDVAMADHPADV